MTEMSSKYIKILMTSNTKNHLKIELGGVINFPMVENLRMVACDSLEHSRTRGGFAINAQYTYGKNFLIFFRYTGISVVTLDLTMTCESLLVLFVAKIYT